MNSTLTVGSMHTKPVVTDDIDEICSICHKTSVLPFFDGVCSWCTLKCKACGESYPCEHDGKYKGPHVEDEELLFRAKDACYKLMNLPASRFSVRELWHIMAEPTADRVWILEGLWDRVKPSPD